MIRRVRTWTGKKTHASRRIAWADEAWEGKTFCSLRVAWLLSSYPGEDHPGIVCGDTTPIDCVHCRKAVKSMVDSLENALAGFST